LAVTGIQSALDPAGPVSAAAAQAWWIMFWGSVAIFLLTIGLALYAALRNPDRPMRWRPKSVMIGLGLIFPVAVLVPLLVYAVFLGRTMLPSQFDADVFLVDVRGHQFWWEISYPGAIDGGAVYSANELHIPVGRPVHVRLTSDDVVHSFWVPQLGVKMDATPGLVSTTRIEASQAGVFRGQCAEFCGQQHARMALLVHAHEPPELERRLAAMASSGTGLRERAEPAALRAFEENCAGCHSIDPGARGSGVAPNLAGVAARSTLGAGTLENQPGALAAWIKQHPELKPGSRKPSQAHLEAELLDSVAAMLEAGR
jgi:cytochrome c oxidase subunit II